MKKPDIDCLVSISRCIANGFDGLCGKGPVVRRLRRLESEGFVKYIGEGQYIDEDSVFADEREWPIWTLTEKGQEVLDKVWANDMEKRYWR